MRAAMVAALVVCSMLAIGACSTNTSDDAAGEPSPAATGYPTNPDGSRKYADYLNSSAQHGAVGAEQCNQPVAKREGKWFCFGSPESPNIPPTVPKVQAATDYCNVSGCYKRYDDFHSDFQSNAGWWGYNEKVLGYEHQYMNWQLVGSQTVAKPVRYENTVATINMAFSASLLNAAPGAKGSEVPDSFGVTINSAVPANEPITWQPNGWNAYDNKNWDHTATHQMSWEYPGIDGYWYAWTKSIPSHTTDHAIYRYFAAHEMAADPYGFGFHYGPPGTESGTESPRK